MDDTGNILFESKQTGRLAIKRRLGRWFLEAAQRGALDYVPVVNCVEDDEIRREEVVQITY